MNVKNVKFDTNLYHSTNGVTGRPGHPFAQDTGSVVVLSEVCDNHKHKKTAEYKLRALTSKYCSIRALLAFSSSTLAGDPCRSFCSVAFGSKQELLRRLTVFSYTFADSDGEY